MRFIHWLFLPSVDCLAKVFEQLYQHLKENQKVNYQQRCLVILTTKGLTSTVLAAGTVYVACFCTCIDYEESIMIVCCRLPPGQGDVPTVPWCGLHSPIHEDFLQTPLYSYCQQVEKSFLQNEWGI